MWEVVPEVLESQCLQSTGKKIDHLGLGKLTLILSDAVDRISTAQQYM